MHLINPAITALAARVAIQQLEIQTLTVQQMAIQLHIAALTLRGKRQ